MVMMGNQLCLLLAILFCSMPSAQGHLWAWLYSLPEYNAVASSKSAELLSNLELKMTACSHEQRCPEGLFCDHHFGLCFTLRDEGEFCRQDAHCAEGLICMFGKCQESLPEGQEGFPLSTGQTRAIGAAKKNRPEGIAQCLK
ncbi:hypothetical protein JD844_001847 [Phrynosoma platyrhinos]|uniref:Dickkopf N-terminal cysteine-rich domain-containing protein n=1 Tax=Phrynosoma platyrhinos TaxID=52577 RepID=A0ABQ7TB31_PHRPL|nr:hypothetical protein JD844_001847 [Phrynosoma platyrhinos]